MPDFDHDLQERIATRAAADGVSLAVAESLTGGLLTDALATSDGSGEWLRGGIVAYATEVKRELLGVDGPVISQHCAVQMADAARRLLRADVGVGITGVGGPDRQEDQPVGTVFIACTTHDGSILEEHAFEGDAAEIVDASIEHALRVLLRTLEGETEVQRG
ncbi:MULTISPECIES: CinA family protein [unclassified Agrococcus]|uniref:CinA family protein n=1 Tax=unclassified Agrococcus TaxID=2615065 RepID=UPI00360AD0FC